MQKEIIREKGNTWGKLRLELKDGRLSITGSAGRILTPAAARKEAKEYWTSFFEAQPEEIIGMNKRCGRRLSTAKAAARFVVETDGEFHGLDVAREEDGRVYIDEQGGCGEWIQEWFPEVAPYQKWHLNDMKAGCEHQEALGWGHGRDVALDAASATPAQLEALTAREKARVTRMRAQAKRGEWEKLKTSLVERVKLFRELSSGRNPTLWEEAVLARAPRMPDRKADQLEEAADRWLDMRVAAFHPVEEFRAEVFKDSIGAPCPTCGYLYGTKWLKRELPAEVVAWVENFDG